MTTRDTKHKTKDKSGLRDRLFGMCLKKRRTFLGMTQQVLAARVGLTFQQINKYETGSNKLSATRLLDFCTALDVSVEYFYEVVDANSRLQPEAGNWRALRRRRHNDEPQLRKESIVLLRNYYRIEATARVSVWRLVRQMARQEHCRTP